MFRSIRFIVSLLLVLGLCIGSTAYAAEQQPPILSINGSGSVESAPDQADLSLGVVTHATNAEDAQALNAKAATGIRNALASLGIADRDIRTEDYSFRPDYDRSDKHYNEITGYTVSNTVKVRINDLELVGQVIDAALANGANNVNSLDFSIRDTKALRRDALTAATKDAREKAEIIARALGKQIIGVQNVSENSGSFQPRMHKVFLANAAMDMRESTPIEAGTLTLTADVHVDFILAN